MIISTSIKVSFCLLSIVSIALMFFTRRTRMRGIRHAVFTQTGASSSWWDISKLFQTKRF